MTEAVKNPEVLTTAVPDNDTLELKGLLRDIEQGWQDNDRGTFDLSMGDQRIVVVSDPVSAQQFLTDRNYEQKGPLYIGVDEVLGRGLLSSDGESWQRSHRVAKPSFLPRQIAAMTGTIVKTGMEFVDDLIGEGGREIDFQQAMTDLTLDTLFATMFGEVGEDQKSLLPYRTLTAAFEFASKISSGRQLTAEEQGRYAEVMGQLDKVATGLVEQARGREPDGTLLSVLAHSIELDEGERLDERAIRNELLTILFAGHETTALTLTWMHTLLAKHSDVADRLREEVQTVLGGRPPTAGDLRQLTYTGQVIDETLRIRPIVPIIGRTALENGMLGDTPVEANDIVLLYIGGLHRQPKLWDNPEVFDPERFSPGKSKARGKWDYVPFASGRRICLGRGLAQTEMLAHTALMAQHVELAIPDEHRSARLQMTLRPSEPVMATVTPR